MLQSIMFLCLFVLLYFVMLLYPKTDGRLNIVKQVFIVFFMELSLFVIPSFLLKIKYVTLDLNIMSCQCILFIVPMLWKIYKKKKRQLFYLDKRDLLNVLVVSALFLIFFLSVFSVDLNLCYAHSDIANHFDMAMDLVRGNNGSVGSMFFSALINATLINVSKPFLPELYYYKAFIIGDAMINWLGWMMFYVLLSHFLKDEKRKKLYPIAMILFYIGYPLYSYYVSGSLYWTLGVLFIGYIMYILDIYKKQKDNRKILEAVIVLAICALGVSYMLFVPIAFIATFVYLLVVYYEEGNLFNIECLKTLVKMFGIPAILLIACVLLWTRSGSAILSFLQTQGSIYSNLYTDFLIFVPFVIYNFIEIIKKKKINCVHIFTYTFTVFTAISLLLCHEEIISRYYYYKLYYPLWMLFCLEAFIAIECLIRKKEYFFVYYLFMFVLPIFLQGLDIEDRIIEKNPKMQQEESRSVFFPLQGSIWPYIEDGISAKEEEVLDISKHILDCYSSDDGYVVPCVGSKDNQVALSWYDGITGNTSYPYFRKFIADGFSPELEAMLQYYADCFVVFKNTNVYKDYQSVLEKYTIDYENEVAVVYVVPK